MLLRKVHVVLPRTIDQVPVVGSSCSVFAELSCERKKCGIWERDEVLCYTREVHSDSLTYPGSHPRHCPQNRIDTVIHGTNASF